MSGSGGGGGGTHDIVKFLLESKKASWAEPPCALRSAYRARVVNALSGATATRASRHVKYGELSVHAAQSQIKRKTANHRLRQPPENTKNPPKAASDLAGFWCAMHNRQMTCATE